MEKREGEGEEEGGTYQEMCAHRQPHSTTTTSARMGGEREKHPTLEGRLCDREKERRK